MHVAIRIHSRSQTTNETLQEYIQIFTDFVILTTGTDPTTVTCQVTTIIFIRHLFNIVMIIRHLLNNKSKKQVVVAKTTQTLRHAMTLAQEAEIKLNRYEGLNNDDPAVVQINSILLSEAMAI